MTPARWIIADGDGSGGALVSSTSILMSCAEGSEGLDEETEK